MKEENDTMRVRDEEEFQKKKAALMEKCFACYAEKGLASVGIRALAEAYEGSYALTPSGGECTASLLLKGAAA